MNMISATPSRPIGATLPAISQQIWDEKYRLKTPAGEPIDLTVEDSWRRVARALASVENDPEQWERTFDSALQDFKFLPGGRILAGAGVSRRVTLFNCFVMGTIEDDLDAIFSHLREAALTMQHGGGIGYDFSTLRPKGALVKGVGADASGPLSFMDVWNSMCGTIMSAGTRRGAMMATMRCDHPDIEAFVAAKADKTRLRNFNLSVLVTDAFMAAVDADKDWPLVFGGEVYRTIWARDLWDQIMRANFNYADPGVIFIDRINARNNLYYCETIAATNPCGEQPLPPYGACLLGSNNLAKLVRDPFTERAHLDEGGLARLANIAVRMLDNTIDVSEFALPEQREEALAKRRIGLGVTGVADALAMCRLTYGTPEAAAMAARWNRLLNRHAYIASIGIAKEKGAFPLFDRDAYLAGETVRNLDDDIKAGIFEHGIRNALLTSIAPTGTISLFAENVSSGIEPIFDLTYLRKTRQPDNSFAEQEVEDYAVRLYREKFGADAELPDYFVTAQTLTPADHIRMQAAVQDHVDASISKTVNCPADISFEDFKTIYVDAYRSGCKGCTTYRPNAITGSILSTTPPAVTFPAAQPHPAITPREERLAGATYKLRWPESEHAFYVTINDIEEEGRRRPYEVFLNSKSMEHYAWVVALTRMISAVFRRGGDVAFVAEELKAVFDPRGGHWSEGRYVPSLVAAFGSIIERHMIDIGFLAPSEAIVAHASYERPPARALDAVCPKCSQPSLIKNDGCLTCRHCGWSKCS
ncbi:ribonucleotide reductase [Methylosinus sp. R-45379]|uniref:adenosylcobalamin-dependent ribonucleoside-diphosphate reductase n=1 Tax=Methylosinus sp. R-45379 TaxID=980563 RepID=UPI0007C989CB|nr:adenosylcobalamin-dependent ribonucleoside-diphosphate reductase [Methylosinus sp. R-45379]OAI28089.1 ribonucleotide reductase [Methylosinus sp. R-45379]